MWMIALLQALDYATVRENEEVTNIGLKLTKAKIALN